MYKAVNVRRNSRAIPNIPQIRGALHASEVVQMERKRKGFTFAILGIFLFLISLVLLLQIPDFYLGSLVIMFIAVVFIGLGSALAKGYDIKLETTTAECYFCSGSGTIESKGNSEVCPRCGGTGKALPEDSA